MVTEHDHLPCPEDTALLGRGAKGGAWIAAAMGPHDGPSVSAPGAPRMSMAT